MPSTALSNMPRYRASASLNCSKTSSDISNSTAQSRRYAKTPFLQGFNKGLAGNESRSNASWFVRQLQECNTAIHCFNLRQSKGPTHTLRLVGIAIDEGPTSAIAQVAGGQVCSCEHEIPD